MNILQQILTTLGTRKTQSTFLTTLLTLWLVIPGRINYANLARFAPQTEKTFRNWFAKPCDFLKINLGIIRILQDADRMGKTLVLCDDASFIRKAGKATAGIAKYWNGSKAQAEQGLELSNIVATDLQRRQAISLNAVQTPASFEAGQSRVTHYATHMVSTLEAIPNELKKQIKAIAVDAFYTKFNFIDPVLKAQESSEHRIAVIGKMRKDANLSYRYEGPRSKKAGRPRETHGKVDWKDFSKWTEVSRSEECIILTCIAKSKALKRWLRVVLIQWLNEAGDIVRSEVLFCTDFTFDALLIIECYRARFEMEFCFRDGKGFAGLEDCQARNTPALEFHWNTAFMRVNLTRAEQLLGFDGDMADFVFSMEDAKRRAYNEFFASRIIALLPPEVNRKEFWEVVQDTLNLGVKAA
jgi:putative transposase